jgi:hypothetical protein
LRAADDLDKTIVMTPTIVRMMVASSFLYQAFPAACATIART